MLRGNRFRLITLGRLTLEGEAGEGDGTLAGRKSRLAVLAMLAMAKRPVTRDTLVDTFWGEQDEAKARHSLSNVLSSFRRVLGADAIATRETEIALSRDAPLSVDALELSDAIDRREYSRAVDLYGGPFLDGVVIEDSPGFDQWVARERRRLAGLFVQACSQECSALAASRRWDECASLAARWLDVAPLTADAAIYLLNSIRAPGTRTALTRALDEYERLRTRLVREFELSPEPPVTELADRIRERLAAAPPDPVPEAKATVVEATAPAPATTSRLSRSTLRWSVGNALAAVVAVLAFLRWGLPAVRGGATPSATPVIAVLTMDLGTIDSASRWLADGLPQMITGKLARSSAVDIVPAERARAALARSGRGTGRLEDAQARDVASRIGATLVARGTLGTDGERFVLDLTVHDVGGGDLTRNHVLSHTDALALADEAAVRILEAANVRVPGPQLSELETRSLEAYQRYLKALEALHAGRFSEALRDIDAAIALDSGFLSAVRTRLGMSGIDEDPAVVRRLQETLSRNADRTSEFDRRHQEAVDAFLAGDRERSDALARAFVRRYPRDPRAYNLAQRIIGGHGNFAEAQEFAEQGLALDSLVIAAGSGPCAACVGYSSIVDLHWVRGDFAGALAWARRWVRAYPAGAPGWVTLAWAYAYTQRSDSALLLMQRAASLAGKDPWPNDQYPYVFLVTRQYDAADSAIASMAASPVTDRRVMAADLRVLLERERGRLGESMKAIDRFVASSPTAVGVGHMMRADNLRLGGEYAEASRMFESIAHVPNERLTFPIRGAARAFCWHHALAADALGPSADTIRLNAIADTLERGCSGSFYGRDWRLHHHVRGLVAMQGRRYAEAEREFRQAIWISAEGWGRVLVELANAQSAQGRPRDGIATLRAAYATRLNAMGRYVPISEVDYRMAKAFAQAGEVDSARVYAAFVRRAWRDADPGYKRLLADLPR